MRIGIDIQSSVGQVTGLGVYTKHLVEALQGVNGNKHEFRFYRKENQQNLNTVERLLWENRDLPRQARRERIEILHIPAFAPPLLRPCRTVVTVHDLIGMVFPNQLNWPSRFYWGRWLPNAAKGAEKIIADSENTKKDILKYLGVPEKKVIVIYPSGHEGFSPSADPKARPVTLPSLGIKERYFLAVGTLEPRKNLMRVIEAFGRFLSKKPDTQYQLVIVGSVDFAQGKFFQRIKESFSLDPGSVLFTGYLPREEVKHLYSGAEALVFPSLYEGFGLPILEAMGSGTPVITSRTSSLPEVAGDAAFYVDPLDSGCIAEAMALVSEDRELREELVRKGFERTKHFSWRQTAEATLKVYESLW